MGPQQHIVVIEHDQVIWELINRSLEPLRARLVRLASGVDVIARFEEEEPQVVIIDMELPRTDAFDLCRRLRHISAVPMLAIGHTDRTDLKVQAFSTGIDDFLSLPFDPEELHARVQALMRRARGTVTTPGPGALNFGRVEVNLPERRLLRDGEEVRLTRTEWALLEELIRNSGRVMTHRLLLQRVWGDAYGAESEYLRVYMGRLRRKLEDDPANPRYLLTEPGLGYRFVTAAPVAVATAPQAPSPPAPLEEVKAPTNLHPPSAPLIGREHEVATARKLLLRDTIRLLTLTGPGGTGKTRLALQVGEELQGTFADGVFFVALSAVVDQSLVFPTIAQALGIKERGAQSLSESLKAFLSHKQLLLILDNFEQVVAAAPLVSELLAAAPRLKVLVTSRAILRVTGEHEFPVPPLALPNMRKLPQLHMLAESPAVALFVERAQAVKPDFQLTSENARIVADICTRLEGLPLAIELAAARSKMLTPQVMLARLSSRLKVLVGGARDLPVRQQTLRDAIGWSYDLLDEEQRQLFRRLGIFIGGCTLEAVETACTPLQTEALDGLTALVDHSLLTRETDARDEVRFVMLETIREYALERLAESGELDEQHGKHAHYYLELAERAEPELRGQQQVRWLEELEREHDNLRSSIQWALDHRRAEVAIRLGAALWRFWFVRGYLNEGRRWLGLILELQAPEQTDAQELATRSKLLHGAGVITCYQNDYGHAQLLLEQSSALSRSLGHDRDVAHSMNRLAEIAWMQGEQDTAVALLEESLALHRQAGNTSDIAQGLASLGALLAQPGNTRRDQALRRERAELQTSAQGIANVLNNLGVVAFEQGDYERAKALHEESLELRRLLGDRAGIARALGNLGEIALFQERYDEAMLLCREALTIYRELGEPRSIGLVLANLGTLAYRRGSYAQADAIMEESLSMLKELGDRSSIAQLLDHFAALAAAQQEGHRAAVLAGAAEALRAALNIAISAPYRAIVEQTAQAATVQLGAEAAQAARAEGQAMPLDEVIGYALGVEQ